MYFTNLPGRLGEEARQLQTENAKHMCFKVEIAFVSNFKMYFFSNYISLICQEGCDEKPGSCKEQRPTRYLQLAFLMMMIMMMMMTMTMTTTIVIIITIKIKKTTREQPVLRDAGCKRDPLRKQDHSPKSLEIKIFGAKSFLT